MTPPNTVAELEARVKELEDALAGRSSEARGVIDDRKLVRLLIGAQRELLDPVYAILHNSDALAANAPAEHRSRIARANHRAARVLERTLLKLIELARLASGDFRLRTSPCSLQSLTHEAVLLTRSLFPEADAQRASIGHADADLIARTDGPRIVHVLASVMLGVSGISKGESCTVSLEILRHNQETTVAKWVIEAGNVPDENSEANNEEFNDSTATLNEMFSRELARVLNAQIMRQSSGYGMIIEMPVEVLHPVDELRVTDNVVWSTSPILLAEPAPNEFAPIRGKISVLSEKDDCAEQVRKTGARLLVLHRSNDGEEDLAARLHLCESVDVPVLLRAATLSYDDFYAYRDHLDAILLEPCRNETLARYVAGLSLHDRREKRRPAEIHS